MSRGVSTRTCGPLSLLLSCNEAEAPPEVGTVRLTAAGAGLFPTYL